MCKPFFVIAMVAGGLAVAGCDRPAADRPTPQAQEKPMSDVETNTPAVRKTDAEWKTELTDEQYRVARCGGTEAPFTGQYWNCKEKGEYRCACCGAVLFDSDTKYDSGTGWPSFYAPADPANVAEKSDTSGGMVRTEVICSHCGAHLGHVFDDGPNPTGQRFCINSAALKLEKEEK